MPSAMETNNFTFFVRLLGNISKDITEESGGICRQTAERLSKECPADFRVAKHPADRRENK